MATANQSLTLSYRIIRKEYQTHCAIEPVIVDHYAKLLSPFLTRIFVRAGIIPNVVTVFMMISGIVGAVFFALPPLWAKIVGLLFIHLWYVLDCSDGEVARITQRFSAFGTEIDYLAHAVNHPLFNLSFAWSMLTMYRYNSSAVLACALLCISAEMLIRHLIGLMNTYRKVRGQVSPGDPQRSTLRIWAIHVVDILSLYPNFALLFPILVMIDRFAGTSLAPIWLVLQTAISLLVATRMALRWTKVLCSE